MSKSSKSSSFYKILFVVISIAFGVVVLAILYKGTNTSSDIRSRASDVQETAYKSWEFTGPTTEGWVQSNLTGFKVSNGYLLASATNKDATLSNKSVNVALPLGNKYLKFRLAVFTRARPIPKSTFSIVVRYNVRGIVQQKSLPVIAGTSFGNMYEYSVKLPEIDAITIDSMQVILKPMKVGMSIQLDWIRLMGQPPPTPTPTVTPTPTPVPCVSSYPYVTISPSTQTTVVGGSLTYTYTVTNNDSSGCTADSFTITGGMWSGWTAVPTPALLTLMPGQKGSGTITFTPASDALFPGTWGVAVNVNGAKIHHSASANANFVQVAPIPTVTPTPTPTPQPVSWGKALQFLNPTYNASYAVFPRHNTDVINLNKEFTLEFWFMLDDLTPYRQHIVRMTDLHLDIFTEKDTNGFTHVKVYVSDGTNWDLFYATGNVVTQNTWNHFALSYIPSYMGGSFITYLNGVSTFRTYQTSGKPVPFSDNGVAMQFSYSGDSYPGIVNGKIDELRISDIVRYPYTSGPGTYTVPVQPFTSVDDNTRSLFHLDNTVLDNAGHSPNIDVTNAAFVSH